MPFDPPTTSTVPTERLWSSDALGTTSSATASSVSSHTLGSWSHSDGMPMGATTTSPEKAPPGVTKWPTLAACSATVTSAITAGPWIEPLLAPTPLMMSTLTTAPGASLISSMTAAAGPLAAPVKPGAEDGVDDHVGHLREHHRVFGERPVLVRRGAHVHPKPAEDVQVQLGVARVLLRRREQEHGDFHALVEQLARDHEPVPAVVALAGEHHGLLGREPLEDLARPRPDRRAP